MLSQTPGGAAAETQWLTRVERRLEFAQGWMGFALVTNHTVVFSEGNRNDLLSVDPRTKAVRDVLSVPTPDTLERPAD